MIIYLKFILIFGFILFGFIANRLDSHLIPKHISNPLLYNIGKLISYAVFGLILGLGGFLIKINGFNGGIILFFFTLTAVIITISHIPLFPKVIVIGLKSHHHSSNSFIAGITNIFSSSPSLHIMILVALSHGYYIESGLIMICFAIGSLYIPGEKKLNINKLWLTLQILFFTLSSLFILGKALLYTELYIFNPFETRKTAVVPEVLNNTQYLKTEFSNLDNRIVISKGIELIWLIIGENKGDKIYIPHFKHRSDLNDSSQSLSIKPEKSGIIYFTGTLGRGDYAIKVMDTAVDVYNLPYKVVLDSGYGNDIHGEDYLVDQSIPDIEINELGIASIKDDKQQVEVEITSKGYTPSVIILKSGIPAEINFKVRELTESNKRVIMPSYNEYLEFTMGDNPINIPNPNIDFIFYSWQGEFGGYVLIVDDLETVTKEKVERQIRMFNINGI